MAFADGAGARRPGRGRELTDRRELLASLYGAAAEGLSHRIDELIHEFVRPDDGRPMWSEDDAWLIAYPDHFGRGIAGVREVVAALAPAVNGVHVLPFHPSSSDGGFSVMDFATVDPAVGDWDDLDELARSHRLMADAVINHVSARGEWFQRHLAGDPAYAGFFRAVDPDTDLDLVVRPRSGPPLASYRRDDGTEANYWATFSADQIDLDVRSPAVLLEIVRLLLRYLEHGATAIRLDAVAYLWKDPATSSIHLPETHAIVALIRSVLDEVSPRCVLITETNVPHDDNVAYFGSASAGEAHAVYQFPLAPLVLHAVQTGDVVPLCRWASSVGFPPGTTFLNFLASHDGVGVRPAKGWLSDDQIAALASRAIECGGAVNVAAVQDGAEPYELTATWRSLCGVGAGGAVESDEADKRVVASYAVALALRGIPLVYAHSFAGAENATEHAAATGVARDVNRLGFSSPSEYLDRAAGVVGTGLRTMLSIRRSCAAFHPDVPQRVWSPGPGTVAIERDAKRVRALVLVNLASTDSTIKIGEGWYGLGTDDASDSRRVLGPFECLWLERPGTKMPVSSS